MALAIAVGWFALVLVVRAPPSAILAASPTRIDLLNARGNRTGSAVVAGDRIDLFNARSNRTGSGRIQGGTVETFDRQGSRTRLGRWPVDRVGDPPLGRDPSERMMRWNERGMVPGADRSLGCPGPPGST
jgi:hypothetical protein